MNIEFEFKLEVRKNLNALNDKIDSVLSQLIKHSYPKEVKGVVFEIFTDTFTTKFPVRVFFMDGENNEIFIMRDEKTGHPLSVEQNLINIACVYQPELETQYTEKDEDLDPWSLATETLITWFSQRWLAAGGRFFDRCATIAPHDSRKKFNLVLSAWQ
ncbi:FIG01062751: hypothetical protein [hydrothermal vent metagenome]|uniref:Uncharacterized protein n=1 Tax=hydrothermal vent metagenome TaxID=652676 RepID=A0A3B0Y1G7_9ZZZZ